MNMLEKIREHIYWNQENYAYGCAGMLGLLVIIGMFGFMFHVGAKAEQEMKAKEAAELVEKQRKQEEEARLDKIPLTLVKKEVINHETFGYKDYPRVQVPICSFFFDADGNTNTIEWTAIKPTPCVYSRVRAERVMNVGETKTRGNWTDLLTHKGEKSCHEYASQGFNKKIHKIKWERL